MERTDDVELATPPERSSRDADGSWSLSSRPPPRRSQNFASSSSSTSPGRLPELDSELADSETAIDDEEIMLREEPSGNDSDVDGMSVSSHEGASQCE